MKSVRINIYRAGSTWCYAAWVDDEYDSSDTIDVSSHATEEEVRAEILRHYRHLGCGPDDITRISDCMDYSRRPAGREGLRERQPYNGAAFGQQNDTTEKPNCRTAQERSITP